MLARLGLRISAIFRAFVPDPFVLAVLLTVVTLLLTIVTRPSDVGVGEHLHSMVRVWAGSDGVWNLLAFGMQMCLILVTGHALVTSRPMRRVLDRLAGAPTSPRQAILLVGVVAMLLGLFNWGVGLVGGALLARQVAIEMKTKGRRVHYPLLCASGYLAMLVWHGGFSGSAPLKMSNATDAASILGENAVVVPLDATLTGSLNLVVTGGLLVIAPILLCLMHPDDEHVVVGDPPAPLEDGSVTSDKGPLPRLLEDTPLLTVVVVVLIGAWAVWYYGTGGVRRLGPNEVNLTLLMLGLIAHGTPARYLRAVEAGTGACAGIILQFPLYAGIMGLMKASGLTTLMAEAMASGALVPLKTFGAAAVVNLFVPSGGGQWAIQGPIAMEAARDAGIDPARMVMAVAYGDEVTNMLQPFWALPLLAITRTRARDIVGYTAVVMLVAAAWMALWLVIL
ncbi:MAG: short-chain fatty acid transporter [Phycisphaerales bacterium]|nr:short-chain fatty acid transporter [Phycisphaerales bacterium]